uniref:Integrase_H2C2 domain-containing protein n=1 Tax=Trichuris muris TaxID=70415 RepID=A0A5S6QWK7_TRIMR
MVVLAKFDGQEGPLQLWRQVLETIIADKDVPAWVKTIVKVMLSVVTLTCDMSKGHPRPFLPQPFRRTVFEALHSLTHNSIKTAQKLLTRHYVWPRINKDVRSLARQCLTCQRTKIHRHVKTPPKELPIPDTRFDHVHVDLVGPLPSSRRYAYLLTMGDRFNRWPEAVPLRNCRTETVARAFTSA